VWTTNQLALEDFLVEILMWLLIFLIGSSVSRTGLAGSGFGATGLAAAGFLVAVGLATAGFLVAVGFLTGFFFAILFNYLAD